MRHRAVAPVFVVLLGSALAGAGDLTIRQRVSGTGEPNGPREETQYLTATKRITDSVDARLIIDLDTQTMLVATKPKKSYQVLTFDEIRQQTQALRTRFESLPPDAKKMLPDFDGEVTVKPTGKTDTLLGHPAKQYAVASGLATGDIWVTDDLIPPGDVVAWQTAMTTMSGPHGPGGKLAAALAQLKGLPLKSTFTTNVGPTNKMTVVTEVLEVTTAAPPASALAVPAGFEKAAPRAHP